jgi:hypothetical protein
MRRFDLLDEYSCVAVPRRSPARDRSPLNVHGDGNSGASRGWRYGMTGVIAILAIAIFAL